MRGILGWGSYLPHWRLDRSTIAAVAGAGGGTGKRTVASYDEDTTTMAVEAARGLTADALWFSTVAPAYLDKTNAAAVHAALRLERSAPAYDAVGSVRSAIGALRAGLAGEGTSLVVASDVRTGLAGGLDEAAGGDGAAALLVGEGDVVAEVVSWSSATEELLDRWRTPGDLRSKVWEERFGETRYVDLALDAWKGAGIHGADHVIVTGTHDRAAVSAAKKLGVTAVDGLLSSVGNTGAAHPALLLASVLERASAGQTIALVVLADGADVVVLRATEALASFRPRRRVDEQVAAAAPVAYGRYLAWRGVLPVEPPRRPEPARTSSPAATRGADWKFGLGSLAGETGTITTFTVDRLAYSPSPPVVFAVVDLENGERLPVELTDCDADEVAVGRRVEMTFRRLSSADGIHNYFWKGRLAR